MSEFRLTVFAAAVAASMLTAGCATVVEGSSQPIHIETTPIAGAACTLSNNRGEWMVVTPGTVTVRKSSSVLKAVCSKPGWKESSAYMAPVQSTTAVVGTVLLFGLVETAVDASTGAGNDYPGSYTIVLVPL